MALKYRNRRNTPVAVLKDGFEAAVISLGAEFLRSAAFQHALTKGEQREKPVQQFFRDHLPEAFRVDSGEVVDISGRTGPQLDVMVSDKLRNFPIFSDAAIILPAEALLVSVEIKSELTLGEIKKCLIAADRLKQLRPFKLPLAKRRTQGEASDNRARYFHCLFAYKSDLAKNNWAKQEYSRFAKAADELNLLPNVVDRIYVANHGLIDPDRGTGFDEGASFGSGLMQFYMHILGFLGRENRRREGVPYLEYAGKMAGGWKSLR